jgi:16S rRNA processing protein RimM
MNAGTRRVLLGRIVGVYGVRGEVKIESFTEPRLRIFDYQPWLLERDPGVVEEVRDVRGRAQGKGVVAALVGIGDRDRAASLVGANIFFRRSA